MLKTLYAEIGRRCRDASGSRAAPAAADTTRGCRRPTAAPGRSRDNPVDATFLSRTRLNKPGSQKETWHVEFDLAGTGIDYVVGDSFGIFPVERSRRSSTP